MAVESNIPHETKAEGKVNEPIEMTIYNPQGIEARVRSDQVEYFQRMGFTLTRSDPPALLAEVEAAHKALLAPIQEYANGSIKDGFIDTADSAAQLTAHVAVERFVEAYNNLVQGINVLYPVRQGDTVTMKRDGREVQVDPNQVAAMREEGYRK